MRTLLPIVIHLLLCLLFPLGAFGSEDPLRIAVLGDSLTAGYGLEAGAAFPRRLQSELRSRGYRVEVLDAGVSGDTTAGGRARLDWLLADDPDLVIVELGANDALRGLSPRHVRENLDAILSRLKEAGVKVLLAGMRAPRNLGREYTMAFDRIYPELARSHDVPLYPFFLEGVAGRPELNQDDGLHPNAAGVDAIVSRLVPVLEGLLPDPEG